MKDFESFFSIGGGVDGVTEFAQLKRREFANGRAHLPRARCFRAMRGGAIGSGRDGRRQFGGDGREVDGEGATLVGFALHGDMAVALFDDPKTSRQPKTGLLPRPGLVVKNGSKMWALISSVMPTPVSITLNVT